MSKAKPEAVSTTLRGQMLRRAGIAGGLIVVLLVALAWFESQQRAEDDRTPPPMVMAPPPPEVPSPAEAPPLVGASPMPSAAEVESMVAAEGSQGAGADAGVQPASVDITAAPQVSATPERVDETPPAKVGKPRLVLKGEDAPPRQAPTEADAAPPPPPVAKATPAPAPAAAPAAEPSAMRKAYMVQLGVFAAPGNAEALHEKVAALGIESHIESRVVVGPFKDRAAADAAREKLRKSGLGKGLVIRNP